MQRSVLLLLVSSLLLCAALAMPASVEKAEDDWLDEELPGEADSEELQDLDISTGNHIKKRSAKDASSSSEEHKDKAKDKANSSGDSSSEEKSTTTTEIPARKRREILSRRRREVNADDQLTEQKSSDEPELDDQAEKELDEILENTSIEDYAQGCEVSDVVSVKEANEVNEANEANEATYAE